MVEQRIRKIYSLYFCEWLFEAGDENLLSLGNRFNDRISDIIAFKAVVTREIEALSSTTLDALTNGSQNEQNDADHAVTLKADKHLIAVARTAPVEIRTSKGIDFTLWALGLRPMVFADYNYWAKFDKYTVDELVWLSTGLTPKSRADELKLEQSGRLQIFPLAEIERRRNLIERAFPAKLRTHIGAHEFQSWVHRTDFEAHEAFINMVEESSRKIDVLDIAKGSTPALPDSGKTLQPREFRTAARIITAMAIDVYGYVPNQKRSKTTKDILDACDKAGLSVSKDTIVKFLRAGEMQQDE